MYYNTTNLTGTRLSMGQYNATSQEMKVMRFFRANPRCHFSPSQIRDLVLYYAPITSARRCLTDLTQEGKLVKTKYMVNGEYGKPCHTWILNE